MAWDLTLENEVREQGPKAGSNLLPICMTLYRNTNGLFQAKPPCRRSLPYWKSLIGCNTNVQFQPARWYTAEPTTRSWVNDGSKANSKNEGWRGIEPSNTRSQTTPGSNQRTACMKFQWIQTGSCKPSLQVGDPYLIENLKIGCNTSEENSVFEGRFLSEPLSPGRKERYWRKRSKRGGLRRRSALLPLKVFLWLEVCVS